MNIRKIIKEELLKEVGGYDDPNIMGIHASSTLGALTETYSDLTNTLQGLANAIMSGERKENLTQYLMETSQNIDFLIEIMVRVIKDFTEDDLILKVKNMVKSLKTFKRKVDVLSNFSDAMGDDSEFMERTKVLLMDLIPSIQEYGEQLQLTNNVFKDRFTNMGRGTFGSGFSSN
jgi:hypothetical protein